MMPVSLVGDVSAVVAVAIFMMDNKQDHTEEEANRAHGDVGDAQEGILASHPGNGAQNHALPSLKAAHGIVWVTVG